MRGGWRGSEVARGDDGDVLRRALRARGIKPCISRRRNARPRSRKKLDLSSSREKWVVERTFAWLYNFRRLVVRWRRKAHVYLAFLFVACLVLVLRAISG